mgnify:CR=1 FL=1|jgi:uncharacterized membrane protein (UPF0127 family)|tara:strand:+ start:5260 stop:5535 length:276 start_codon:yes stop_codon:yes gene_type:complete
MKKVKGLQKYLGLMFKKEDTEPLMFEFDEEVDVPIHSWFVFFPFMAYWYDSEGILLQSRKINPFRSNIRCCCKFKTLIEIPWKRNVNIAKE